MAVRAKGINDFSSSGIWPFENRRQSPTRRRTAPEATGIFFLDPHTLSPFGKQRKTPPLHDYASAAALLLLATVFHTHLRYAVLLAA